MILLRTNDNDRVTTRHYRPEDISDRTDWYEVDETTIPEPEDRDGERAVLYYDGSNFWHEYVPVSDADPTVI